MRRGQILMVLIIFIGVGLAVISAAVAAMVAGSTASFQYELGLQTYAAAESGIENALIRTLRDPGYSGETLTIGPAIATITVTGTNPKVITSTAVAGEFVRRVQVTAAYTNGVLTVGTWQEIY